MSEQTNTVDFTNFMGLGIELVPDPDYTAEQTEYLQGVADSFSAFQERVLSQMGLDRVEDVVGFDSEVDRLTSKLTVAGIIVGQIFREAVQEQVQQMLLAMAAGGAGVRISIENPDNTSIRPIVIQNITRLIEQIGSTLDELFELFPEINARNEARAATEGAEVVA